jgi:hypothetical protein
VREDIVWVQGGCGNKVRGCGAGEGIEVLMRGGNRNRNVFPRRPLPRVNDRGRGRPRKTWRVCVEEDMAKLKLIVIDTHDRVVWRNGILENRINHAAARKNDVKR